MNKAAKLFPQVDNAIMRLSNCGYRPSVTRTITFQLRNTHPFSTLAEDVSEEERAEVIYHFRVLTGSGRARNSRDNPTASKDIIL